MGYVLSITRQENWFDDDDAKKISMEEWKEFVAADQEMRMDNFAEATTKKGETITVTSEGLAVWTTYSENGVEGNHAWFDLFEGNVNVKNPDDEIIYKMIRIATKLNAKVQGEECETYIVSSGEVVSQREVNDEQSSGKANKKPWWKFW
jgi:hypothetical protein